MGCYQQLNYHEAALKASHNSYDLKESLGNQLYFTEDPSNHFDCGCRGLELDIWRHTQDDPNSENWFTVNHLTNGGDTLSSYLDQLKRWHSQNLNHDVIGVSVDIKSSGGDANTFPDQIDRYLTNFLGRDLLLTTRELFSGIAGNNLSELVKVQGWPMLSAMTNKFLFFLSGTEKWKSLYSEIDPANRLCFADATDARQLMVPNSRAVYNVKSGRVPKNEMDALRRNKILIRVYNLDSEKVWQNAHHSGANILATNKISGSPWAAVSTQNPYSPFENNQDFTL